MRVEDIPISDIIIRDRRREDYGDIPKLAASISKYRLMEPIVVEEIDGEFFLIAGERRIKAFQFLTEPEIPAHVYTNLTPEDRDRMELEENDERLNLTPFERSKRILQKAEKIEEIISSPGEEKDSRGRKAERKAPKKDIADAIGVSVGTLVKAEQHVAAVESHPELKDAPQKTAIAQARKLDKPVSISTARKPQPKNLSKSTNGSGNLLRELKELVYQIKTKGGLRCLARGLDQTQQFRLIDELDFCAKEISGWRDELTEALDNFSAEGAA